MFEKPLPKIKELDSFPVIWAVSFNGYKTYTQLILWVVDSGPPRSVIGYYSFQKTHLTYSSDLLRDEGRVTGSIGLRLDLFSVSLERCDQLDGEGSNGFWKYSLIVTRNSILQGS